MKMKKNILISACALGIFLGAWHSVAAQEAPLQVQQALDDVEKKAVVPESVLAESVSAQPASAPLEVNTPAAFPPSIPVAEIQPPETPGQNLVIEKNSMVIDVLELKDMDIGDVLKLISKKSGLNIISGKNVVGKVTIYLKNVDVRDALRIILESNDLAYVEEGGIIKVIPGQEFEGIYGFKFGQDLKTRLFN